MARFDGKVAIVTGAASGIGRATALAFAEEGASVLAVDLDERGRELDRSDGRLRFHRADVSQGPAVQGMVKAAVGAFGSLDVIFNNAGIFTYKPIHELSEDEWDRVIAVNLRGCFLGIKYAVPELRKRGGGAIVNTASVHGFATAANMGAYGPSKHAVIGLTRGAALDLAPLNIRVNCVCPGAIDTPLMRSNLRAVGDESALLDATSQAHALGRVGRPEEVAKAVLFLASDDASFITGAPYLVDGGYLARLP